MTFTRELLLFKFAVSVFHNCFAKFDTCMTFYAQKHTLFDGECLLYRRQTKAGDVNPVWQMRLKVRGLKGYVTLSCKTTAFEKACVVAKTELDTLHRKVADGASIKDWTFAQHWQDWFDRKVSVRAWKPSRERWHKGYFNRYFNAYFGNTLLSNITAHFADEYWIWRINFWTGEIGQKLIALNPARRNAKTRTTHNFKSRPAHKTLLMEQSVLNEIFNDALRQKRMQSIVKIKAPRGPREDARRPDFDEKEWAALAKHLVLWSAAKGTYRDDRVNEYHLRQRQQLWCYVWLLASSGLRVGEANKLRWEDIETFAYQGRAYLQIKVRSDTKTGARSVFPMNSASHYLRIWKRIVGSPQPQQLVFSGQARNGSLAKPLTDANKTFQAFLKSVPYKGRPQGLLEDADGKRRTLYSLRHTYATIALLSSQFTEMDLARNMGTSVAQIEKHYSHVKNHHRAAALSSVALPGHHTDADDRSLWQSEFALNGHLTPDNFKVVFQAPPMSYELVMALSEKAAANHNLLPFIDVPNFDPE